MSWALQLSVTCLNYRIYGEVHWLNKMKKPLLSFPWHLLRPHLLVDWGNVTCERSPRHCPCYFSHRLTSLSNSLMDCRWNFLSKKRNQCFRFVFFLFPSGSSFSSSWQEQTIKVWIWNLLSHNEHKSNLSHWADSMLWWSLAEWMLCQWMWKLHWFKCVGVLPR